MRAKEGGFFRSREGIIFVLVALVAAAFFVRLFYLQIIVGPSLSAEAERTRTSDITTNARRGTIYDRNGNILAVSVEAKDIYANPQEVTDPVAAAKTIAQIIGGDAAEIEEKISDSSASFVYLARQADVSVAETLEKANVTGVHFLSTMRREYPYGEIGGQVIGFCNIDGEGVCGLELQYDDILKGTPGHYVAERGRDGTPIPGAVVESTSAVDGQDIMISLDIELQEQVQTSLAEGKDSLEGTGGTALVLDAETGEIYAAASLPFFNPADTSKVESGATTISAISGGLEPGSVFKGVAAMAALETGAVSLEEQIDCPAVLEADQYTITDSHDREDTVMTLREILAQSSNVGIALAGQRVGFDTLYEKIKTYGFTKTTGVDYPGESAGYLVNQSNWSLVQSYNICFGQGLSVTPLQVTRFYGAIANDGVAQTPHFLVRQLQKGEAETYVSTRIISSESAIADMKSALRSVVTDGTGSAADIEGYCVVGKTSTAEIADESGGYREGVWNLGFVGFIDKSTSKLVCYVGVTEVPYERQVTGIFHDIMSYAVEHYRIASK